MHLVANSFFQKCWAIVGPDVTLVVKDFFYKQQNLQSSGQSLLVLTPKDRKPLITCFCPMALGNIMLKFISHVMVRWMKTILNMIISPNLGVFIG